MPDFSYMRPGVSPFSPFEMGAGQFNPMSISNWGAPPMASPVPMPGGLPLTGMGMDTSALQASLKTSGYAPLTAPGASMPGMRTGGSGLGANMETANLALTGLNTIGNLWAAFNAQKLAREQFNYTKGVTETNLANQIKTYNTGITDRANNRAIVEGNSPTATQAYIDKNSLSRYGR